MKIYHYIENQTGEIWVIKTTENNLCRFDSESRQAFEARIVNKMILECVGDDMLDHTSNGAPYLINHNKVHVSISHSDNWFALYVSRKNFVGVDLEVNSTIIQKTKNYFLTPIEINRLKPNETLLQICWGVKESVYKLLRGDLQSLKYDIQIASIEKEVVTAMFQSQEIKLKFQVFEEFTLVYTC